MNNAITTNIGDRLLAMRNAAAGGHHVLLAGSNYMDSMLIARGLRDTRRIHTLYIKTMKRDKSGKKNYAEGEVISLKGKRYIFKQTVPNHPAGCDIYRIFNGNNAFCSTCNGCGTHQPEGCHRGTFLEMKETE